MKTKGEMSARVIMIHMILYHSTDNISFQTAIIRLPSMISWWIILGRKYPLVKLQLLHIVSGSNDAYVPIKGYSRYTYYSRQHQNQAKIELQQNVPVSQYLF